MKNPALSTDEQQAAEVVTYTDMITIHVKAIEDGLIHSDETPLNCDGELS